MADAAAALTEAVHVWTLAPHCLDSTTKARYEVSLSDEESARWHRYLRSRDRDLFVAARGFLRQVLSQYLEVPAAAWRFDVSESGKPSIANPEAKRLQFNLSHTPGTEPDGGLVAVAVTVDVACGIDVESLDSVDDPLLIAASALSAYERADLANQSDPRLRFFEYWTLKEAYLKARGAGLRLPLDRFGFVFDPDPRLCVEPPIEDDPLSWQFAMHQLDSRLIMAIAVQTGSRLRPITFV
ncbi:MAG: 4'-phosphopantetheinyl transferase superfamily protein [Acidimicrobiia bacterium]|nr:4'-phosphopantetheinyl transferase superfamily protein [Acidimicrobiia bacterium]